MAEAETAPVTIAWTTVGNVEALAALARAVKQGPAHAYLFVGPSGVGKLHAAVELAAALNCEGGRRPCGECRSCRDTFRGQHPDVELVSVGGVCDESGHNHSDSREIGICQVRRLEHVVSLKSYTGGWRVGIIDGAERLSVDASNAFLKTLEEPPERTVLVLISEREEILPETVRSRCQRIVFARIERQVIEQALEERGAEPEVARTVAAAANGRLGWALRALDDRSLLEDRSEAIETSVRLAHAGRVQRFAWPPRGDDRNSAGTRERYLRELDIWEHWWRDVLSVSTGTSEGLVNVDRMSELHKEGKLYSATEVVRFLKAIESIRGHLKENVDAQLALENLMLDLPQPRLAGGNGIG